MTDLTPERRAEMRAAVTEDPSPMGSTWWPITGPSVLALLDAADERDRLAGVEDRLSALLWRLTNGRLSKTDYPVEFMEQEIEENLTAYHESDLRDERDRLAAQVERVRALHVADGEGFCRCCDYMTQHPCETNRALDGAEEAHAYLPVTEDADGLTCDICGAELGDWAAADHHIDERHTP